MRLSEAILLGRHLVEPRAAEISRCALGMALAANGVALGDRNYVDLCARWPWLRKTFKEMPCECPRFEVCPKNLFLIGHLFDLHVMYRDRTPWTLEQLVDWVRSVEPAEPIAEQESLRSDCVLAGDASKVGER